MFGVYFIVSKQGEATEPAPGSSDSIASQTTAPAFDARSLEQSLQSIAASYPSLETGVAVVAPEQDQFASLEGDIPFMAASTAKIIASAYAINQIENGNISFDSTIGNASLKEHIERMIIDSDNDAWYAILNEFGYPAIAEFGNQNGAPSFNAADNTISPLDMSRFMSNLHQGRIISSKNTAYMEDLMVHSDTGTITLAPEFSSLNRKAGWLEDRQNITGVMSVGGKTIAYTIFAKSNNDTVFSSATGNILINDVLKTISASLE